VINMDNYGWDVNVDSRLGH
ncbi:hypothetical protein CCACVL1_09341, partial [Corchorus capsularis]